MVAIYGPQGFITGARILSRDSINDPWSEDFIYVKNNSVETIVVGEVPIGTRSVYSECYDRCDAFFEVGCDVFQIWMTSVLGPKIAIIVAIGCPIAGWLICVEYCTCFAYGSCSCVPGCSSYPPCICDPYEDCD